MARCRDEARPARHVPVVVPDPRGSDSPQTAEAEAQRERRRTRRDARGFPGVFAVFFLPSFSCGRRFARGAGLRLYLAVGKKRGAASRTAACGAASSSTADATRGRQLFR